MFLFLSGFIITITSLLALHLTNMVFYFLCIICAFAAIYPRLLLTLLLGTTLGVLLGGMAHDHTQSLLLPIEMWQKPLHVQLDIDSIIYDKPHAQSALATINDYPTKPFPNKIKLTYYERTKRLNPGDHCDVYIKLKPIHGYSNPGGRDIASAWRAKGVTAQGYIVNNLPIQCAQTDSWRTKLFHYRSRIKKNIEENILNEALQQLILALAIGEKQLNEKTQHILQKTGTSHLLAISGLHVGLVGLMIYAITKPFAKIAVMFKIHYSARAMCAICSLIGVIFYILITGNAVSSQRAGWMYTIGVFLFLKQSYLFKMQLLLFVMSFMIFLNPFIVEDLGFWLSSSMVFILVMLCGYRLKSPQGWIGSIKLQWQLSLVAFPLTLLLLKQSSLISPIANIIAIPIVSFGVVPLLILFDLSFSTTLLKIAEWIMQQLWLFLSWWENMPVLLEQAIPNVWVLIALCIATILLMMPKGLWAKSLGIYFLCWAILYPSENPKNNQAWITWLDVGQGLSVVIQTAHHVLVYDTGPRYEDLSVADLTLIPFLKKSGIQKIDKLMISHADNDHRGGIPQVLKNFTVQEFIVGQFLSDILTKQISCHENKTWEWDGVIFEQWNIPGNWTSSNNHSCVLKISTGKQSVLLLGDIEREGELALLKDTHDLQATVISVPHHGSQTSSTMPFIQAINPQYAIFSAGFLNSYHHPHPRVKARYDALGVRSLDTGQVGSIRVTLTGRNDIGITCHRDEKC